MEGEGRTGARFSGEARRFLAIFCRGIAMVVASARLKGNGSLAGDVCVGADFHQLW